jgi:hypothetical protein
MILRVRRVFVLKRGGRGRLKAKPEMDFRTFATFRAYAVSDFHKTVFIGG